jgi:hypothetical protein
MGDRANCLYCFYWLTAFCPGFFLFDENICRISEGEMPELFRRGSKDLKKPSGAFLSMDWHTIGHFLSSALNIFYQTLYSSC